MKTKVELYAAWLLAICVCMFSANQSYSENLPKVPSGPKQCFESSGYVGSRQLTKEVEHATIAVCGSRAGIGTSEFRLFWADIIEGCANGNRPLALWDNLYASPLVRNRGILSYPTCEEIIPIASRFGIRTENTLQRKRESERKRAALTEKLRSDALKSNIGKFLLAAHLLNIENTTFITRTPETMEAIEIFENLSAMGFQEQVYRFVSEMQARHPEPLDKNPRRELFMFIYGGLSRANDPRGFVKLAENDLHDAKYYYDHGDRPAMMAELYEAKERLSGAKRFSTGELATHVANLEFEVRRLENSPTVFHIVAATFVAGASFLDTWENKGISAALDESEYCAKNKPPVDLDPTLRLAYAIGGCIPY